MANLISGSTAIAINPQFDLMGWSRKTTDFFRDELQIDLAADDPFHRNFLRLENAQSRFFICENMLSPGDARQFRSFAERSSLPVEYGLRKFRNMITWLHATEGANLHGTYPLELDFALICFLLEEDRSGVDVNGYGPFMDWYNEIFNRYFLAAKNAVKKA